jgi:hypothetical protein
VTSSVFYFELSSSAADETSSWMEDEFFEVEFDIEDEDVVVREDEVELNLCLALVKFFIRIRLLASTILPSI